MENKNNQKPAWPLHSGVAFYQSSSRNEYGDGFLDAYCYVKPAFLRDALQVKGKTYSRVEAAQQKQKLMSSQTAPHAVALLRP